MKYSVKNSWWKQILNIFLIECDPYSRLKDELYIIQKNVSLGCIWLHPNLSFVTFEISFLERPLASSVWKMDPILLTPGTTHLIKVSFLYSIRDTSFFPSLYPDNPSFKLDRPLTEHHVWIRICTRKTSHSTNTFLRKLRSRNIIST